MASNKVGRGLAKAVGIDVDQRNRNEPKEFINSAAASIRSVDKYYEEEPTAAEFVSGLIPSREGIIGYVKSLFPFHAWILHYNLTWGLGDFIAGVTVGFVVIPQGMAYALLAELPAEYGLYTSFVGFFLYWAFATSKDITIGTVAVMSTLVGRIVIRVQEQHGDLYAPEEIARCLSVLAGAVLLFLGLFRLGWIVELIPLVGITSFMTGAAISIAAGQVPRLLGVQGVNTRESTYLVIINTLRRLPTAGIDAAMGVSALAMLYLIRFFCNFMAKRQPAKQKMWFFISTLRMAFVILLYILISWLVNRGITSSRQARFSVLGSVPSGFQVHSAPNMPTGLVAALAPDLFPTILVLIIEHIAISKSFGRINNYVINPSQELVAVGFTNVFGPFLGAYPATGSFSRTAIKSKAGVRTPLAGIWTAVLVLLALYVLTSVFFYIPQASLSGLIIHAVGDLITPPNTVYQFWLVSPLEVIVFFITVILMIFTDLEIGIYVAIGLSVAILAVRIAKAKGKLLGRVKVYRVNKESASEETGEKGGAPPVISSRDAFVPLDHSDGSNPAIDVEVPYPGVFIYRFVEGFNYLNAGRYMDILTSIVKAETRPTTLDKYKKLGDRPWNDPGPRRGKAIDTDDRRPILRAIILDCSTVNNIDVTAIQALIDTRNQLDGHASPEVVDWHIAGATNRWARRGFAAAGFGFPSFKGAEQLGGQWKPIFSVASVTDKSDTTIASRSVKSPAAKDEEMAIERDSSLSAGEGGDKVRGHNNLAALAGVNRPNFHIDIAAALESAVANIEGRANRDTVH
jgi:sodium-independent sulfate anion transporter 11